MLIAGSDQIIQLAGHNLEIRGGIASVDMPVFSQGGHNEQ